MWVMSLRTEVIVWFSLGRIRPRCRSGSVSLGWYGIMPRRGISRWLNASLMSSWWRVLFTRLIIHPTIVISLFQVLNPCMTAPMDCACLLASTIKIRGQPICWAREAMDPILFLPPSNKPMTPSTRSISYPWLAWVTRLARVWNDMAQGSSVRLGLFVTVVWNIGSIKSGPILADRIDRPRAIKACKIPRVMIVLPLPEQGAARIKAGIFLDKWPSLSMKDEKGNE